MARGLPSQTSRIMFLTLIVPVIISCTGGGTPNNILSPPGTTTAFILVRHAEKVDSTPESPLSAVSRERAHALVEAWRHWALPPYIALPCGATAKQFSRCPNTSA